MDVSIYHDNIPDFILKICQSKEMQRLKDVGMNCGCEYTQFPLFKNIGKYSRYEHSVGVGLIVWHFTGDVKQSIAGLLHDIATPCFAHTIDFANGDYEKQESTEERTAEIIRDSEAIAAVLKQYELSVEDVADYHLYPIADNDSPRLSADRLEYTLGNIVNYGFGTKEEVIRYYQDLIVSQDRSELVFKTKKVAEEFGLKMLQCSNVYVANEDRYSMQMLAELVKFAMNKGIISLNDLYTDETTVIRLLKNDEECCQRWNRFCNYSMIVPDGQEKRIISAKKRYIDPMWNHQRLSTWSSVFNSELKKFKNLDFTVMISAR